MDKHACCQLAENEYRNGQWPESYITWEFLADHPRAMESGYFHVDWNSIPRLYNRKSYLRMLVIEKEEWDHLSNPTQLKHYWEPTQDSDNFHPTWGWLYAGPPFMTARSPGKRKSTSCRLPSCKNRHGISDYHLQQLRRSSGMMPK